MEAPIAPRPTIRPQARATRPRMFSMMTPELKKERLKKKRETKGNR
jgi:hypothetical protein